MYRTMLCCSLKSDAGYTNMNLGGVVFRLLLVGSVEIVYSMKIYHSQQEIVTLVSLSLC